MYNVIYDGSFTASLVERITLLAAFDGGLLIFSSNLLNTSLTGMQDTVVGPDDSGLINPSVSQLPLSCIGFELRLCSIPIDDRVLVFWLEDKLTIFDDFLWNFLSVGEHRT